MPCPGFFCIRVFRFFFASLLFRKSAYRTPISHFFPYIYLSRPQSVCPVPMNFASNLFLEKRCPQLPQFSRKQPSNFLGVSSPFFSWPDFRLDHLTCRVFAPFFDHGPAEPFLSLTPLTLCIPIPPHDNSSWQDVMAFASSYFLQRTV